MAAALGPVLPSSALLSPAPDDRPSSQSVISDIKMSKRKMTLNSSCVSSEDFQNELSWPVQSLLNPPLPKKAANGESLIRQRVEERCWDGIWFLANETLVNRLSYSIAFHSPD